MPSESVDPPASNAVASCETPSMAALKRLERDSSIRTTALVVLTFLALAAAMYFLRPVLMPFVLALFIAGGVSPVLSWVERYLESSRAMAVLVTLGLSIVITALVCSIIWVSVERLRSNQGQFEQGGLAMLARAEWIYDQLRFRVVEDAPTDEADPQVPAEKAAASAKPKNGEKEAKPIDQAPSLEQWVRTHTVSFIGRIANELFTIFSSGMLVLIFLFFLLLGGSEVKLPENNIWRDIDAYIRQYILAKALISAVTGLVFGLVLWLFGVPLALVFGLLAFLLNFIPNLGPIVASLLPLPLVWVLVESRWAALPTLQPGEAPPGMSLAMAITAIVLGGAVQFLSGNVVEPKIMGDQFRLHPIAILLSLMFWYMIWGVPGAFLAVPITSAIKIILAELESTRSVALLLEGNLALLARKEPA